MEGSARPTSKPLVELLGRACVSSALQLAVELGLLERLSDTETICPERLQDTLSTILGAECSRRGAQAMLLGLVAARVVEFDKVRGTLGRAHWVEHDDLAQARVLLAADIFEDLTAFQRYTRQDQPQLQTHISLADPHAELRLCALGWIDPTVPLHALVTLDARLRSPLVAKFSWDALLTAIQAGLFQIIAEHRRLLIPEIAETCQWNALATKLIVENLCAQGLLTGSLSDGIRLTPLSQGHLVPSLAETRNHHYIGDYFALALQPEGYVSRGAVRVGLLNTSSQMLQHLETDALAPFIAAMHGLTVRSATAMACASELKDIFDRTDLLVDIGGGSGAILQEVLTRHPHIVGVLYDLENVCDLTRQRITTETPHIAGRIKYHGGDMFADIRFPAPSEARPHARTTFVLGSILHDWSESRCVELLAKSFLSLPQGGNVIIHELLLNDNPNESTSFAVAMNLAMLQWTEGRQFTASELRGLVEDALAQTGRSRHGYAFLQVETDDFFSAVVITIPPQRDP